MVFEDMGRRRWKRALCAGTVLGAVIAGLTALIVVGAFRNPRFPAIRPLSAGGAPTARTLADVVNPKGGPSAAVMAAVPQKTAPSARTAGSPLLAKPWVVSAFVVQGDPRSVADLAARIGQLDIVFPDWYSFDSYRGELVRRVDPHVQRVLATGHAAVLPRLSNTDLNGRWRGDEASEMLKDWDSRPRLIEAVVSSLQRDHAAGINVDIEGLEPGDRENFLDWLYDLGRALHRNNLFLVVDLPLNDEAFDYEAIGEIADAVIVMGYDEHFPSGASGPIASKEWFNNGIESMSHRIPPSKLLVALGGYGYDWNLTGRQAARPVGFDEAMVIADAHGGDIRTDRVSLNSRFSYREENGELHEVWFLDAVSAWNQMLELRRLGLRGASLWRLGLEEPALWEFLARESPDTFDPRRLAAVVQRPVMVSEGEGELLRVGHAPADGRREITLEGDRRTIGDAVYAAVPRSFFLERFGHDLGRRVALTFDDGPDPVWTPEILRVLRKERVPATFFIVGDQAEHFPRLLRRIYDEGHLIGNHTFTHPEFEAISPAGQLVELNLAQRVIQTTTGHSTALFRSPYNTDTTPDRAPVLRGLGAVTGAGYITVGADIDSGDYRKPGVEGIVTNVVTGLRQTGANIVVFHDAGGDRRQTVEALERLIPMLRGDGYEFVGVDRLMGVSREAVMSGLQPVERAVTVSGALLVWLRTWGWKILEGLFLAATTVAIARILFVGYFALKLRQQAPVTVSSFQPPVAVIVPAFNEARVIRRTLGTLLASDYPHLRILVVDDGSTDDTAAIVADMARSDPRMRVVSKPNGGKHSALNLGFRAVEEEFIVTIDADTLVPPRTIGRLIAPFADARVDAVCGNVQVGNVRNLLTAFQDVEYVTSQNYDRRAFDVLNCISVVPGATGAWRRSTVLGVGGYSPETLTEDADLTLSLLGAGGRIVYAPEARSVTEAPEGPQPLFRQRFRWSFGSLQCLWKHRQRLGYGTLGCVALPNMLIFQVLFPLLSPLGDAILLWSLLRGELGAVAAGYCTFVILDLVASSIAFRLDRHPVRRLGVVLIQRLYYRQFMYLVTIKAVIAALRGGRHGWNKLERRATVAAESGHGYAAVPAAGDPAAPPVPP